MPEYKLLEIFDIPCKNIILYESKSFSGFRSVSMYIKITTFRVYGSKRRQWTHIYGYRSHSVTTGDSKEHYPLSLSIVRGHPYTHYTPHLLVHFSLLPQSSRWYTLKQLQHIKKLT
jgi:hypothetical protein